MPRAARVSAFAVALLMLMAIACTASAPPSATSAPADQPTPSLTASPVPTRQATAPATQVAAPTATPQQSASTPDRPFGARTKDNGCMVQNGLPDRACTPGAVFPDATAAQICTPGYSSSVRNVPAEISRMVYVAYGIPERSPGEYEVDHLVPLELGGSNDIANLWPQAAAPPPGFHEKDQVENYLHNQVCGSSSMNLLDAQRAIATNWVDVYQHLPQRGSATTVPTSPPATQPESSGSVAITTVTGGRPGGRASVAVHTTPGATCSISYRTPAGTPSTAQGLEPRVADPTGNASWSWNIGRSTRPGTGTVAVTCNGATATTPIQIG